MRQICRIQGPLAREEALDATHLSHLRRAALNLNRVAPVCYDAPVTSDQPRDPEFQLDTPTYEAFHATVRRLAARVAANAGLGKQGDRFAAYALAAPDLIVLAGRALTDDRVPRAQKGEILASVLYLASPIDIF